MWPQKWNASASPGFTRAVTAPPPAISARSRDVRARKPRRDVDAASPSPMMRTSGSDCALRRRDDPLELSVAVERPLRAHPAVAIQRDRVRTARDAQALPHLGV